MKARTNPSMAAYEQVISNEYQEYEEEDGNSSENGGSVLDSESDSDPDYSILEENQAKFSTHSIRKKSKSHKDLDSFDEDEEILVQKIVEAGKLEKLKVEQCKVYLRKNGLRLSGNKSMLIQRIKEHLEISNGEGEKKYPVSSFVLNCKGDACAGDILMFEQNVYDTFNIAYRSASGPPCGKRIVAGRVVKESYGAAKQQHTFTIEVLWSNGEKPLPPLHPLLIKGRNLYRLKTLRQRWEDEGERSKVLMEKHSRGFVARSKRETRIQEKEKKKMVKANRMFVNEDLERHAQLNLTRTENMEIMSQQQPALPVRSNKMKSGPQQLPIQPRRPSLLVDSTKLVAQPQFSDDSRKAAILPQLSSDPEKLLLHPQEQKSSVIEDKGRARVLQNPVKPSHINRQPLKTINHHFTTSSSHNQGCMKQQLCPYYPRGRCYFGDKCKFLHELREECAQKQDNRWHHGVRRQFERQAY